MWPKFTVKKWIAVFGINTANSLQMFLVGDGEDGIELSNINMTCGNQVITFKFHSTSLLISKLDCLHNLVDDSFSL